MSFTRWRVALFRLGQLVLGFVLLAHPPASAADTKQTYAIDGAGLASCKRYATAAEKESRDYFIFVGWIDGYLTAMNRENTETYDLTPWQTTQTLADTLAAFCENHPNEKFASAVQRLANTLYAERLREASKVMAVRRKDRTVLIYESVLDDLAEELIKNGYLEDTEGGRYDEDLERALKRFQREQGIKVSGIPDQATLARIFRTD